MERSARSTARAAAQAAIDAATLAFTSGAISEVEWQHRVSSALATAYLGEDDRRWQSGFDGDAELWRQARELILDAVSEGGTFLDVGCASGHLLESLEQWALERQIRLTFYGLEINADLAAAARLANPENAHRIFTGNVSDWIPPQRFTYVRTGLEYVPHGSEDALIRRAMNELVDMGGKLIVGPVNEEQVEAARSAFARAGHPNPAVHDAVDRNGKTRFVLSASNPAR